MEDDTPGNIENDDSHENEPDSPGEHTGCFQMQNIVQDFKQTVGTHWLREMINFNQKTIGVSFFLFFAAVAPAITFGAIYAKVGSYLDVY